MTNLTDNQKQVLNAIKQNGETSINDKDFCYKFELNTRSFKRTVKSLVKKGLLIETKERFTNFNNGKFFNDSFVFVKISEDGLKVINEETQAEEVPALTADQLETLTSISKNHHYCCSWRNPANIMAWMDDLANLGLIKFICDIVGGNFRFKLEITQAGIDILKQETITDSSDIEGKSEFSCNDPSFNFNEYLVQTAENYDRPLTKKAVENIFAEITKHHQSEFGDYDRIEYALCTESNEYPAGINIDNRYGEFYVLDFADTDVVLHLVK